jgi:signal transduction histidine kinase
MAHEINNPIHTIRLHVGALKRRIAGENLNLDEAKEAVDAIDRSVNLITQVITRMRYFSKRSDEKYTVIDINAVMADSLKMLRRHLEKESIQVVEKYAPSPLTCFGNGNMLEQLFTNLILNARDALMSKKEGNRTITVETHRPKDDRLSVVIRDDGPGMDEGSRSQLFSPFFTTKPDGVGLGLAVVRRIVESHMGDIEVASAPGKGTSFTINFPKDRRREPRYDAPEEADE